jgi:tol-pal system protein YbgF
MNKTRILLLSAAALVLIGAPPAFAQRDDDYPQQAVPAPDGSELVNNRGIERRLERDEKDLRDLRRIVLQARAQGAPVEVREAGPDPQVEALQQRINDLEETLRRQTGQMETLSHDAQLAARSAADANDANRALLGRLDTVEKQLQAMSAAAQPGPPPQQQGGNGYPNGSSRYPDGGNGSLGTQPRGDQGYAQQQPPPSAGPGDEAQAYRSARQILDDGDYVGGASALQNFLQTYPSSQRAPEANYWLGRTLAIRNMHSEAAAAYARALRGWPKSTWGGDAVVRLAASLIELQRSPDACRALAEFDNRYSGAASPAVKSRARDTRASAACGGGRD